MPSVPSESGAPQAVAVRLTEAERSFYEQIVAKARPVRAALQQEDAAGDTPNLAVDAPSSPSGVPPRSSVDPP